MKQKKKIYYRSFNGDVWDIYDIEKAFYISTGKRAFLCESEFLRFLSDCFGRSIESYFSPSVLGLVKTGEKVKAILLYRDENGCSISEAKKAVEIMCSECDKHCKLT